MKFDTSDTRSWTERSCSTDQGLTTLVRYNLFWKPLRRAFSPTFVLLFCLCWSLEEYLVHVRPLKSRFTIFKTDKKSILIPARLMNDRKGIIDRLLKYSRLITTWIALRNGAFRSVLTWDRVLFFFLANLCFSCSRGKKITPDTFV